MWIRALADAVTQKGVIDMDCRVLRQVMLKADGHLGCDDSSGYSINLGHVSLASGWRLRDVLNGPVYRHVRSSFKEERIPWQGVCEGCDLFSEATSPVDVIDTTIGLMVEPTLACTISCPSCIRKQIISHGRGTSSLDRAILARFVNSCKAEGIEIEYVHYLGWGEPLMHDDFHGLYDVVKAAAPSADQIVTTAANVDFRSTVGDCALDNLIVSVDGCRQEAYEKYRRGGDLEKAIRFMRDCKRYGSPETFLQWKYIIFEFNDSDEEILLAQDMAEDIGVDSILFIITNSKRHSKQFTVDRLDSLPLRSPLAQVSPAAAMNVVALDCEISNAKILAFIDKCFITVGKFLDVEGWALDSTGAYVTSVELLVDGQVKSKTRTMERRKDTRGVHPDAAGIRCGYKFHIPINVNVLPKTIEVRITGVSGSKTIGGQAKWHSSSQGLKQKTDILTFVMTENG